MKAGKRIRYEDDLVVVFEGKREVYRGMEDYEPNKREWWKWVETTKDGRGHYEWNGLKKYRVA